MHRNPRDAAAAVVIPPAAIAFVCELLGSCPRCGEPVERTHAGLCSLVHRPGCLLAEATRVSAA